MFLGLGGHPSRCGASRGLLCDQKRDAMSWRQERDAGSESGQRWAADLERFIAQAAASQLPYARVRAHALS